MSTSVYDLREWQPDQLDARAAAARTAADATMDARRILSDGKEALVDSWRGIAGDAAHAAVEAEVGATGAVVTAIDRLGDAITAAANGLEGPVAMLNGAIKAANIDGVWVNADGSMQVGKPTFGLAPVGLRVASQDDLDFHAAKIAEAVTAIRDADAAGARAIRNAVDDLAAHATPAAPMGPATAALAQEALTDGLITSEDIELNLDVLARSGITPESLEALRHGQDAVTLPAQALDSLQRYYAGTGASGLQSTLQQLAASSDPRAQDLSRALGNGLLTLSNERAVTADGSRGGYGRLPGSVRLALEHPRSTPPFDEWKDSLSEEERERIGDESDLVEMHFRTFPPAPMPGGNVALDEFWTAVAAGGAPAGTELSTRLITTASEVAVGIKGRPELHEGAEGHGQSMLDIASRNHDAITGVLADRESAREVLEPLFLRDWADGGTSLGRNVNWMSDEMARHGSGPGYDRAATASADLARFVSEPGTWDSLMGPGGQPGVAELNPSLVRHVAHGMRDTVPFLAQIPSGDAMPAAWAGENAIDEARDFDNARRTLALLTTDPGAHAEMIEATRGHLLDAYHSGEDYGAGRTSALMYGAEHQAIAEAAHGDIARAKDEYARRELRYDSVAGMATEAFGLHAAGGLAGAAAAPYLKDMFLGPAPGDGNDFAIDAVTDRSAEQVRALRHLALEEALAAAQPTAEERERYVEALGPGGITPVPAGGDAARTWSEELEILMGARGLREPAAVADGFYNDFLEGYREALPPASAAVAHANQREDGEGE